MAVPYDCKNEKRREAVRTARGEDGAPVLNGIDYLEVAPDQQTLIVHFLHNLPGETEAVPGGSAPALTPANFRIEGGVRIQALYVESTSAADNTLTLTVNAAGDFSPYTLRLVSSADHVAPPAGFDPRLSHVTFSFKINCPSDFDCQPSVPQASERHTQPEIDYLSRDYASFRRLMLDGGNRSLPTSLCGEWPALSGFERFE